MGFFDILFSKQINKIADQKTKIATSKMAKIFDTKLNKIQAYASGGYFGPYPVRSSDSGGSKYPYGMSADGGSRFIDHYRLRQNARDAFHDSIDARAICESFANDGVGVGLVLDAIPNWKILGIDPKQAKEWGSDVNQKFHLWAKDKKQNRSGLLSFYQYQRQYAMFQHRDNDMYTRLYYSKSKKLQSSLQFESIDPNQIRGCAYTTTYAQWENDDGIIRNQDGTEKSYKVWISVPGKYGKYENKTINRIGEKSGKTMMIHGFNPEYSGQRRGYSRIGFALQELENITDFSLATIKKAINQSNLLMSVENQQQDPGNPLEGITHEGFMSATGRAITEEPTQEETSTADERLSIPQVCPVPEAGLEVPGSTAFVANQQGDTIRLLQNTTPSESFREFVTAFIERLAAAAGTAVEVVLKKFGSNYSASRATLVMVWRSFEIWRDEMAVDMLNVVYEAWISEEIAAGRISAPGFSDPRLRAAWLNCNWIGPRMPNIDPGRQAKATKDNLEMNLTTVEREAQNLNGSSAAENIAKNIETFGIMPSPPWAKSQSSGAIQQNSSEDDKLEE